MYVTSNSSNAQCFASQYCVTTFGLKVGLRVANFSGNRMQQARKTRNDYKVQCWINSQASDLVNYFLPPQLIFLRHGFCAFFTTATTCHTFINRKLLTVCVEVINGVIVPVGTTISALIL